MNTVAPYEKAVNQSLAHIEAIEGEIELAMLECERTVVPTEEQVKQMESIREKTRELLVFVLTNLGKVK